MNDDIEIIDLDEDETITTKQKPMSHTIKTLRKLRPLLIIVAILCFIKVGLVIVNYNATKMPLDHVFVCDNPKHDSEFDIWIREDLGTTWVPTYIIIQDGYVVGAFNGDIEESQFSDNLAMASSYNMQFLEIPDYEIENLAGERISVKDLFGTNGLYILELAWIDCEDCDHQDENYTDDIYAKYSTSNIYRYYIRSEKSKVLEKYN